MKGYDRSKESSYMQYFDVNNLYGWAISQKLPVNNFEWIKDTFQFNWRFHKKKYNEECYEVDVQYLEKLHELHNDLASLPGRMKIEKFGKILSNLHVIQIRSLKQALNNGLVLKKVCQVIKFNQNAWLKPYIDINTYLRKKQKMILKKNSLSWWITQFLQKVWKMWKNIEI